MRITRARAQTEPAVAGRVAGGCVLVVSADPSVAVSLSAAGFDVRPRAARSTSSLTADASGVSAAVLAMDAAATRATLEHLDSVACHPAVLVVADEDADVSHLSGGWPDPLLVLRRPLHRDELVQALRSLVCGPASPAAAAPLPTFVTAAPAVPVPPAVPADAVPPAPARPARPPSDPEPVPAPSPAADAGRALPPVPPPRAKAEVPDAVEAPAPPSPRPPSSARPEPPAPPLVPAPTGQPDVPTRSSPPAAVADPAAADSPVADLPARAGTRPQEVPEALATEVASALATEVAAALATEVAERIPVDGVVLLVDDGEELVVAGGTGLRAREAGMRLSRSTWLVRETRTSGHVVAVHDTDQSRALLRDVPLAVHRRLLALAVGGCGLLVVARDGAEFGPADVAVLRPIAEEAAQLLGPEAAGA